MTLSHRALLCAAALILASACADEPQNEPPIIIDDTDQSTTPAPDMADDLSDEVPDTEEDIPTFGDASITPPELRRREVLIDGWPLHDTVSDGAITVTEDAGVFTAQLDASAGGSQVALQRPFLYLDLDAPAGKVAISDLDAFDDDRWELALRRVVIRTNSADSGAGQVQLARLVAQPFDAITSPGAGPWASDVTLDDQDDPLTDPIGNLLSAFNYLNQDNPSGSASWYDYAMGVSPVADHVYIVRNATGDAHFKLQIVSWTSGTYTLRWAKLD